MRWLALVLVLGCGGTEPEATQGNCLGDNTCEAPEFWSHAYCMCLPEECDCNPYEDEGCTEACQEATDGLVTP